MQSFLLFSVVKIRRKSVQQALSFSRFLWLFLSCVRPLSGWCLCGEIPTSCWACSRCGHHSRRCMVSLRWDSRLPEIAAQRATIHTLPLSLVSSHTEDPLWMSRCATPFLDGSHQPRLPTAPLLFPTSNSVSSPQLFTNQPTQPPSSPSAVASPKKKEPLPTSVQNVILRRVL
jgi:hypothetical protein